MDRRPDLATASVSAEVSPGGILARRILLAALLLVVVAAPKLLSDSGAGLFTQAAVFGIIGLSLNILMGYAGQISLGHNAFVGVGAFAAAFLSTDGGLPMFVSIPLAAIIGAVTASLLGLVALRIQGLYLAMITLAYGLVAERSIFGIQPLTGGGAGKAALRPAPFESDRVYAYVCMAVLALILFVDWRMMKTKFGRALLALKSNEQVAASFGMNPIFFKVGAFILAGGIAGLGGGLMAFRQQQVVSVDFAFQTALTYVIMVVVGGLGSRLGVVIGSALLSYLPFGLDSIGRALESTGNSLLVAAGSNIPVLKIAISALLLLLTITQFPGGIAQQIHPLTEWLSGKPFPKHEKASRRQRRVMRKQEAFAGMEAPDPSAAKGEEFSSEDVGA